MLTRMPTVAEIVRRNGGAVSYAVLDRAGLDRREVARELRAGRIRRVRRSWFAVPDAPPDVVRAARVGGALTGASALRLHGAWLLPDDALHVRVAPNAARLRDPDAIGIPIDRAASGVCVHHSGGLPITGRDSPLDAVAAMLTCAPPLAGQIALDSVLNLGVLAQRELPVLRAMVPKGRRMLVDRADGSCDSGLETIVRVLLRGRRVRHRTQAYIRGVGRVDILVGDRLILELDGAAFHTGLEFERDRRRDFELVQQGYLVVRLTYSMVMREWEHVERGILALIDRGEHRWRGRGPFDPTGRPRYSG